LCSEQRARDRRERVRARAKGVDRQALAALMASPSVKNPAPSISEITTIEYNRFLVEQNAKEAAEARKQDHDQERALRKEMTERYRTHGNQNSLELKEQMQLAKAEVENFRADNLKKGTEVKEEVEFLRKARKEQHDSWLEHGSSLAQEYGAEQKRRIQQNIGELTDTKRVAAAGIKADVKEMERVRTERQQHMLEDAQKLKKSVAEACGDEVTREAKNLFYEQRKNVGDTTRKDMKVWKESRQAGKEQYAAKASAAKAEALAAKKAAKEAMEGVKEARLKAAREMRDKHNNIETNYGKVKQDVGVTKKQVHDMTRHRKFVSPEAAEVIKTRRGGKGGSTPATGT
jgi:hypothetical protein